MKEQIRRMIVAMLAFTLILGIFYPVFISIVGHALFPDIADGGIVKNKENQVIGSKFIGQNFSNPRYFHPRPSYAGENGYDAMASGGSNLGLSSQKLQDTLLKRLESYRLENEIPMTEMIPIDAITASASGLDPHISLANANLQAVRVAKARNMSLEKLQKIIRKESSGRWLGLFGEPRMNVLLMNLKLDEMSD